jgi:hypothetical protein
METDLHPQPHQAFWLGKQNWMLFNFSKIRRFANTNCQIFSKNFSLTRSRHLEDVKTGIAQFFSDRLGVYR